ncbi:polyurethanase [Pseudomonas sp. PAMC 29040]|uniref:polyurethane esterase n=1 Tax=Pseudomonas sp. PAMC 29040 TaxID=2498450 RepID=UPI000F948B84|nr:polyurethanase [Pseudomonas sp. PAMC 29040]RUT42072.1 polyurethanase [Pseudomonas sp. PAMC 29040]
MAVFDYKDVGSNVSAALFKDALAITLYSYHNLDNGFAVGYQKNGMGTGLPATLVKAVLGGVDSQGVVPGIPWNPDSEKLAREAVEKAGWSPISAQQLGYAGKVDQRGTFFGEKPGYDSAQVEILGKYDADGQLTAIGIGFRGTSGPRESLISDSIGDAISDLLAAIGPADYAKNYTGNAFDSLLGKVAAFAGSQGLAGKDVLVSGHSLGGLAVNSLADLSGDHWSGFYRDASYIAFASPTQSTVTSNVLNIGYENDPVFRALNGSDFSLSSLGVHDANQASATNNIVSFNDHYASVAWNLMPFSIANVSTWVTHLPSGYESGMNRILDSAFYDLTHKDSTIVVANLSNPARENNWVQDLNRNAEKHTGTTLIIGSEGNDLIRGGRGNDFLEGRDGNDSFRDSGGYNIILGGKGVNTLDLQQSLNRVDVVNDGQGTLYVRDNHGGITLARDISLLVSDEPGWLGLSKAVSHRVADDGLWAGNSRTDYTHSVNAGPGDSTLKAGDHGDWLLGQGGNDHLLGSAGNDVFIGGAGDDLLESVGGSNTFVFNGHFGNDTLLGYQPADRLVFLGVEGGHEADYRAHASVSGNDTVLSFGSDSVTLVGVGLASLVGSDIVIA